ILVSEIEETGTIDIRRFYWRRCLRLGPAYVSMLASLLVGAAILQPDALSRVPAVLPALASYTYNYRLAAGGAHLAPLVVVWSLCVEEQFYLVWPWVLKSIGARRGLKLCLGLIAALSAYRTGLYLSLNWGHLDRPSPASAIWIYFATDTRIGVILVGCATALSLRHPRARRPWRWIRESRWFAPITAVTAVACIIFVTGGYPSSASWRSATVGYTLDACASAALIGAVFMQPRGVVTRALSWRPLVSLGRVSYGVYLFHVGVAWLLQRALRAVGWPHDPFARFALAATAVVALTWTVAAVHYHYIERRFRSAGPAGSQSRVSIEACAGYGRRAACAPPAAGK